MHNPHRVVTYDEAIQNSMVADVFQLMLTRVPMAVPGAKPAGVAWLFILESLLLIPSFKNSAFEEEDEVRLHVLHAPTSGVRGDLQFRDGAMGLTPYVEISLRDPDTGKMSAIREIIVGPQPNQAESIRAAKLLVEQHGLEVDVRASDIPLRP